MISFNNLGYMGHLGNQMFQYAALRGIASKKGYWYSIPKNNELTKCFKIPETLPNQNKRAFKVEQFEFDQLVLDHCPDDVDILGFFQSEKYFRHIDNEIRKDFNFYNRVNQICTNYKDQIFPKTELISLHVRRGDYITDPNFECLTLDYYKNAMEMLPNLPVIIFSDDPEWCKKHFRGDIFTISLSKNSHIDLCLMSMCNYHIIANSSFSWWGSWLAKSKKTIAPKKWFSGNFSHWNTQDLYLPQWTII